MNKYANLVGTNKIKDEYTKINTGFDRVEADIDKLETDVTAVNTRVDTIITTPISGEAATQEIVDARVSAVKSKTFASLDARFEETEQDIATHMADNVHFYKNYRGHMFQVLNPWIPKQHTYKGQLHMHTTNSDGANTPTEMMTAYKNAGYDFAAITDHNKATADPQVEGILFIPGTEETTDPSHFITLNTTTTYIGTTLGEWGAIPIPEGSLKLYKDMIKALPKGAIHCLAHPSLSTWPIVPEHIPDLYGYSLFEILNGSTNSSTLYDRALSSGRRCWCTGVDDAHSVTAINKAWIMVNADALDQDTIVDEIQSGNFYATNGATISNVTVENGVITITVPVNSTIKWITEHGAVIKTTTNVLTDNYPIVGDEGYVRIEVTNDAGKKAWSQPIFITQLGSRKHDDEEIIVTTFKPELKTTGGTYNHTYTTQTCTAIKRGRLVYVTINIQLSAKDPACSGSVRVTLPYQVGGYAGLTFGNYRNIALGNNNTLTIRADPDPARGRTEAALFENGDSVGVLPLAASKLTDTTYIMFSGVYVSHE